VPVAGDTAHIVSSAGGKGMNIALLDADELHPGIAELYRSGHYARPDAYSATRLPQAWRAVEFSHWMLQLLLASAGRPPRAIG
jgi:p-hydroxybenzoate 3-monooxygenase